MRDASSTRLIRRTRPSGPIAWLLSAAIAVVACAPVWHHHDPGHHHGHDHQHEHQPESSPEDHPFCAVCFAVQSTGLDLPADPPPLFTADAGRAAVLGEARAPHLTVLRTFSPRGPPSAAAA